MGEVERFIKLMRAGHRCVFISTAEEREAMELLNAAALETGHEVLLWTASHGLRDGSISDGVAVADTTRTRLPRCCT